MCKLSRSRSGKDSCPAGSLLGATPLTADTVMEKTKEEEVPDRINGTYFETKIHKLCYIKHTCESKLASSANDGVAAGGLREGYQKLFINE